MDCHQNPAVSHLRAESLVLPQREHLKLCSQHFFASAIQLPHLSHFRPNFVYSGQYSWSRTKRTLRGLLVRGEYPITPTVIFGGLLGESTYPLGESTYPRYLLRAQIIEEIARFQSPNKVLCAPTSEPSQTTAASVRKGKPSPSSSSGYISRL